MLIGYSGFLSCKIPLHVLLQTLNTVGNTEETEGVICVHKDVTLMASLWPQGGQANNINKCVNVSVYIKKGISL